MSVYEICNTLVKMKNKKRDYSIACLKSRLQKSVVYLQIIPNTRNFQLFPWQ